ncbi:MAG: hypothetical protein ACFE89_04210 [Candidatus Hodarchaeota archaeon]
MAVGRFQVMAVLQAARAHILGLELASAKSWGLNRAIFYAAAKRGFKGKRPVKRTRSEIKATPIEETREAFYLGSEMAFKAPTSGAPMLFVMGDQIQTEADFQRQIERRFNDHFIEAWRDALEYVRGFDQEVLLSQNGFFSEVYKPQRDILAKKWSEQVTK